MTITSDLARDQRLPDAHKSSVPRITLPPTRKSAIPERRSSAASISVPGQNRLDAHTRNAGTDLGLACALLDEIEAARIAACNQLAAKERDAEAAGALDRYRATREHKTAVLLTGALIAADKAATNEIKRLARRHPYAGWMKSRLGIGEKQGGRLLSALEDPLWNFAENRPRRGPAELWQYAGHGDPARSRRSKENVRVWVDEDGEKHAALAFNPTAKMRLHLCSESCIKKMRSPFRPAYDAARAAWADRDTTDGHKHNHALRIVGKEILKDLWNYGREQGL